jgi:Superinfection immunity protein/Uncharacterised protein family UPF0547
MSQPSLIGLTSGQVPLVVLAVLAGLSIFFLPTIIAARRKHAYLWIIVALNVIGGLFAGLGWVAALIWAVWPAERSVIDPIVGNPTGTGSRNAGDTLGASGYGLKRGFTTEAATTDDLVRVATSFADGAMTKQQHDAAKRDILEPRLPFPPRGKSATSVEAEPTEPVAPDTKTCPECAETVKAAARVCRYCSYRFQPAD